MLIRHGHPDWAKISDASTAPEGTWHLLLYILKSHLLNNYLTACLALATADHPLLIILTTRAPQLGMATGRNPSGITNPNPHPAE